MGAVREGKVQVYTGDGKGKTTAALGLALRAAGAGLRVYLAQFVKGSEYSEHNALEMLSDAITVKQYGRGFFMGRKPESEDVAAARGGWPAFTSTTGLRITLKPTAMWTPS